MAVSWFCRKGLNAVVVFPPEVPIYFGKEGMKNSTAGIRGI
jgi:hypothetical protein